MEKKIFASTGEVSGHKAFTQVQEYLEKQQPKWKITKLGGTPDEVQKGRALFPLLKLAKNGIPDVLISLPYFIRVYHRTKNWIRRDSPSLVVLVDFPGFNLRLMKWCKKKNIPVFYLCPPQLWAYKKQVRTDFRGVAVQVLFPMEAPYYQRLGATVSQGHFFNSPVERPLNSQKNNVLMLCPGSRTPVIKRNLPFYLGFLRKFSTVVPEGTLLHVVVPKDLFHVAQPFISRYKGTTITLSEPKNSLPRAWGAIAFPGTFNLELALNNIPSFILARVDIITYWAARRTLGIQKFSLPNILCKENLFTEEISIVGRPFTQEKFARAIKNLRTQPLKIVDFRETLGSAQGPEVAATNIARLINS